MLTKLVKSLSET